MYAILKDTTIVVTCTLPKTSAVLAESSFALETIEGTNSRVFNRASEITFNGFVSPTPTTTGSLSFNYLISVEGINKLNVLLVSTDDIKRTKVVASISFRAIVPTTALAITAAAIYDLTF